MRRQLVSAFTVSMFLGAQLASAHAQVVNTPPDTFLHALQTELSLLQTEVSRGNLVGTAPANAGDPDTWTNETFDYGGGTTADATVLRIPYTNRNGRVATTLFIGFLGDDPDQLHLIAGVEGPLKVTTYAVLGTDDAENVVRTTTGLALSKPNGVVRVIADPTAVEYAVMLALIIIVIISNLASVGTASDTTFANVRALISNACHICPTGTTCSGAPSYVCQ